MSAIIMIEIVVGLVVLVAAVRFAVRDARERGGFAVDYSETGPSAAAVAPEPAAVAPEPAAVAPEPAAEATELPLSELGATETH